MISGIYFIVNEESGKAYVGSSLDLGRRYKAHLSRLGRGKHHCLPLQRAYAKGGSWWFVIVEQCAPEALRVREQHWLDSTLFKYNIATHSGSPRGVRRTEEARKRMSESAKQTSALRAKRCRKQHRQGTILTSEGRASIAAARRAMKGKPISELHKKALRARLPEVEAGKQKMFMERKDWWRNRIVEGMAKVSLKGRKKSPEQRATMIARLQSPEVQAKLQATLHSEEHRQKIIAGIQRSKAAKCS